MITYNPFNYPEEMAFEILDLMDKVLMKYKVEQTMFPPPYLVSEFHSSLISVLPEEYTSFVNDD